MRDNIFAQPLLVLPLVAVVIVAAAAIGVSRIGHPHLAAVVLGAAAGIVAGTALGVGSAFRAEHARRRR